jgi:hypothetical protein
MSMLNKAIRKIKVLGYPFAGGQGKTGVEKTPAWVAAQPWFGRLKNVEFEMVPVSDSSANIDVPEDIEELSSSDGTIHAKNMKNVVESSRNLKRATA